MEILRIGEPLRDQWYGFAENGLQAIINIFSMPDPEYNDKQFLLYYLIDDPIIRKPIAEQTAVLAFQLFPGIRVFDDYLFNNRKCAAHQRRVEFLQFPKASVLYFN